MTNNNCAELNAAVSDFSLLNGKEEKAISCQEIQEDSCQLPQQALHQQCLKPLDQNGYQSSQENQLWQNVDTEEEEEEEKELQELRKRLDYLKRRRKRIQQSTKIDCINQQKLLLKRLNSRRRDRNEIVDEYLSAWKGRNSVHFFLDCSRRWNVVNDCFPIWIDGKSAFATIHGCRIGVEATPLSNDILIAARERSKNSGKWVILGGINRQNAASPPRRSRLGLFGSNNDNANQHANNNNSVRGSISEPIRVPWIEINAALGHACLLLKILQESSKRTGNKMQFTHELHPMGATSKIGIRFGPSGVLAAAAGILNGSSNEIDTNSPPVVHNLFYEEASSLSLGFFKKNDRYFNWAIQAFLQCIAEAAAQQADKTIAIPHAIRHEKAFNNTNNNTDKNVEKRPNYLNGGEWTIGGLSICCNAQQQTVGTASAEGKIGLGIGRKTTATNSSHLEWTRACRFLLTDLKWLVAYAAKHVDR